MNAARAYRSVQNQTASKERLMVLLFERALEHIHTATRALEQGNQIGSVTPITKAIDIVVHLTATLDHRHAPELCERLTDCYKFVILRLNQALAKHSPEPLYEAQRTFAPIVEAFAKAVTMVK